MMNIKIDPRMKQAVQELAEKELISMSAVIKQAIQKHLEDKGIDWRKEKDSK